MVRMYFLLFFSSLCCADTLVIGMRPTKDGAYGQLLEQTKKAFGSSTYIPFYSKNIADTLANKKAVFLCPDRSFLQYHEHFLVAPVAQAIKAYIQQDFFKIVSLVLPSQLPRETMLLLIALGICKTSPDTEQMVKFIVPFSMHNSNRASTYHTVLKSPVTDPEMQVKIASSLDFSGVLANQVMCLAPIHVPISAEFKYWKPMGLYYYLPEHKTLVMITQEAFFTLADIEQNFWTTPVNTRLRAAALDLGQSFLNECAAYVRAKKFSPEISGALEPSSYKLPNLTKSFVGTWISYDNEHAKICAAKTVPRNSGAFDDAVRACVDQASHKLVAYASNISSAFLWLETIPELFINSHGLEFKKNSAHEAYIQGVFKAVNTVYKDRNKPLVLAGLNVVTGNLKEKNPQCPAVDMYGKAYKMLPTVCDWNFWQEQCIETIRALGRINDVRFDGVFFDLEFYPSPADAPGYESNMDFSDCAWGKYVDWQVTRNHSLFIPPCPTPSSKIDYLYQTGTIDDYYSFLMHQAYLIGKHLYYEIKKHTTHGFVGVYMPHLRNSWFYAGFLSGLSEEKSVLLQTCATDADAFKKWIVQADWKNLFPVPPIHICGHSGFYLLSKMDTPQAQDLLLSTLESNEGALLARFSHLQHPYKATEWWANEATQKSPEVAVGQLKLMIQSRKSMEEKMRILRRIKLKKALDTAFNPAQEKQ